MTSSNLTKEQAIRLQKAFKVEYEKESFQEELRQEWKKAGGDAEKEKLVRQRLCLPVQDRILADFGFDKTRAGVTEAIDAFTVFADDAEVVQMHQKLAHLTNPNHATARVAAKPTDDSATKSGRAAEADQQKSDSPAKQTRREDSSTNNEETIWRVVGGQKGGGLLVRAQKDTKSEEKKPKLAHGAKVRQLELDGDRLKYTLLEGDGPSTGWVTIKSKDGKLLEKVRV